MTEDDIQVLLAGYESWNKGEFDMLAELVHPEIEWEPGFGALEAGTHSGADGFRQFLDSWLESFEEFRIEPELLVQCGERIIVVARQRGRGRGSGVEIEARVVHVWTLRDGKAVGWWGPRTLDEALAALPDPRPAVVLRSYDAFNRGDLDEAIAAFDPEVEWHSWIVPGPGGATYKGHDGVRELWADARNVFGEFRNVPERIVVAGDRIAIFVCVRGRGKESGAEVEGRIAHVMAFRGTKALKVDSYEDRAEALRVVGVV
jgi:uncharacterized protein